MTLPTMQPQQWLRGAVQRLGGGAAAYMHQTLEVGGSLSATPTIISRHIPSHSIAPVMGCDRCYGTLWDIMGRYGTLWDIMRHYGALWDMLWDVMGYVMGCYGML